MKNYYFDETDVHHPFTFITDATPGSFPPDNAVRTAPLTRTGHWPCLIDGEWRLLPDNREKIIYSIITLQSIRCQEILIPDGYTELAPQTVFDKWDGQQWVTDTAAHQAYEIQQTEYEKRQLLSSATEKIAICQDAVDLGIATNAEKSALTEWRQYRVLLNRVDCTTVPNIQWPEQPK
ncbi:tail fiber assembly protein [Xenorhabdus bovienii]|uniref:Tail fiber assembly protein n=2 Tax=Xenorhabdus bovienii TaxID=40576 RepID=A0A0B6X9I0_XENBV|nr:tail fiber assembly protein [Xenorhabdus bovienii]CDG97817.1 conserved hypothetical protein [Xenorhabdus bovienii str. puntauvense]CDM88959.1 conserved protein of unknown function [Xenorhabdus bovienii]